MPERRMGPPPHTEDPYTRLTSPRGIPVDQLVSVLQKDIRRGNVGNAVLAASEMLTTSPEVAEHMWHRLKVIAVEDIGMGEPLAPVVLNSLHENYRAARDGEQAMMAIHAVRFLATAPASLCYLTGCSRCRVSGVSVEGEDALVGAAVVAAGGGDVGVSFPAECAGDEVADGGVGVGLVPGAGFLRVFPGM